MLALRFIRCGKKCVFEKAWAEHALCSVAAEKIIFHFNYTGSDVMIYNLLLNCVLVFLLLLFFFMEDIYL